MPEQIDLRYPIGKADEQHFSKSDFDLSIKQSYLQDIEICPSVLENTILNLDEKQLDTPYRDGGWTVKQVIHHVADSHMNAFIRFKLGLTEDNPTIKPYEEAAWAVLSDSKNIPVNVSLTLIHALHNRWLELLKNMTKEDFKRTVFHPQYKRSMTLWQLLATYAWHGKHHAAHITKLKERMGW